MQVQIDNYGDLGRYLRDVRESLQISPRDAAQHLNIRAKYLQALESGELAVLPGKIYARGYLGQYAAYLGLDKGEVLEAYDRIVSPHGKVQYYVPEPTSRSFRPGMSAVVGSVLVLVLIYGYWHVSTEALPSHRVEAVPPVPQHLLMAVEPSPEEDDEDIVEIVGDPSADMTTAPALEGPALPATPKDQKIHRQTPLQADELPWLRQGNQ